MDTETLDLLERINEITGVSSVANSREFQFDGILTKREVEDLYSIVETPEQFSGILVEKGRSTIFIRTDNRTYVEAVKLFAIHVANGKGGELQAIRLVHKIPGQNVGFIQFTNVQTLGEWLKLTTLPEKSEVH